MVLKRKVRNFRFRSVSLYMIVEVIGIDKMGQEECISKRWAEKGTLGNKSIKGPELGRLRLRIWERKGILSLATARSLRKLEL